MVTLKDIAEFTGVSISTVSRALKDSSKISEKTKKLVQSAANELMFQKGVVSQHVHQISFRIGLLYPEQGEYYHDDPSSSADLRSLRSTLEQQGHIVEFISYNTDKLDLLLKEMKNRHVDGLILSDPPCDTEWIRIIQNTDLPFIIVNGVYREKDINSIDFDNYNGMKEITEYVLNKGHQNTAVITGPSHRSVNQNRLDGLTDTFRKYSIKPIAVLPGDFSMESGYERTLSLLDKHPDLTALICFSDYIALGAMKACKEKGYRVPKDISIVGFDDISYAQFSDPPLTTVRRHSDTYSSFVVDSLINLIQKGSDLASLRVMFKTRIIQRQSG